MNSRLLADTAHAAQLIYGAPNISPGEDWRGRSLRCWTNLAEREEGITAVPTEDGPQGDPRTWCGNVALVGGTVGVLLAIHRGRPPRATTIRTQWTGRNDQWVSTGRQRQGVLDPAVWAEVVDGGLPGNSPQMADARPDWAADTGREQCATCRHWKPVTKAGRIVKHKRQQQGRWHMVPCEGGGELPLPRAEVTTSE